jgi:hypothetical protein
MNEQMSLAGWRRTFLADGLVLVSAEGPDAGVIRIHTRGQPLVRLRDLIDQLRARMPQASQAATVGAIEQVHTLEGEYAAIVPMTSRHNDQILDRTIGVIFGDEWFAAIDGLTTRPDAVEGMRAVVRRMTVQYSLGLGDNRRRPYWCEPPRGWKGLRVGHGVSWMAPGFPKNHGLVVVFDARPAALTTEHLQDRMLFEDLSQDFVPGPPQPPMQVVTKSGLRGQVTTVVGQLPGGVKRLIHNCALNDGKNLYLLRLESDEPNLAANRAAFMTAVHSVRPLPLRNSNPGAYIQWQD